MSSTKTPQIASPLSTGGSGPFFEQNVGVFFLSLLTVRGIPPVLKDCRLGEVHFQTNRLGWNTDDLLLIAVNGQGERKQLVVQVKRQFVVSDKNEESRKTFTDFWKDFHDEKFNAAVDKLAIIPLKGTKTLLQDFNNLLDHARASVDGADFSQRLESGVLSATTIKNEKSICKIIADSDGAPPSRGEMRNFLACIHIIPLDLNTESSVSESLIKTILASTSIESDPQAAADATWLELLQLVANESSGMPVAGSFPYCKLPKNIRTRHNQRIDTGPLQILREHCQVTVDAIRETIADHIKIERKELFRKLLLAQNQSQVVVITSRAGAGKSVLAKKLYQYLDENSYCLMFRAEEFAKGHLDNTISACSAGLTAQRLFALLAGQGQITIFVESVDRLLEKNTRDAFSDLLRQIKKFNNMRLILTCRSYSIATVRASFLEQNNLSITFLEVPNLTDDQLHQVADQNTNIAKALNSNLLKALLRNPYMLNKAAAMDWSDSSSCQDLNEAAFRKKCWREVIRRDELTERGVNRRRGEIFIQISTRRAKKLTPFVRCDDFEPEALQALIHDELVTLSHESDILGAPSHDVLEDWATIQWLENEYLADGRTALSLPNKIKGFPALRRGYRKWLSERLALESEGADQLVMSIITDETLPPYFRDDTIVCLLLSPSAEGFLSRQDHALLNDNANILSQIIHLLRVACKTLPYWLQEGIYVPSVLLQPEGKAWAAVINLANNNIDKLLPEHLGLVLDLAEDWSHFVSWQDPEPEGIQDAGTIIFSLLPYLDGYRHGDQLRRALKVIVKIPRAQPEALADLFARANTMDRKDTIALKFTEIVLPGMDGNFCCQFYPDKMIQLSKTAYFLTDKDIEKAVSDYRYSPQHGVDENFGLRRYPVNTDFYPASAIRGPFLALLRHHPKKGIDCIVNLINHACTWYGEQKWPFKKLEQPWKITINIPEDSQIVQWASPILWGAYRGTSNTPHIFETALMALEDWFLSLCKKDDIDVEFWLLFLLKQSNNIAITAVVASICTAYPEKTGKAAIAVLSSRDLIEMDRSRMASEHFGGIFPDYNAENRIYSNERRRSDKLPHRSRDLEVLAINLQLGEQREQIWDLIDKFRRELPVESQQKESDKIWRLALHRMDVRGWQAVDPPSGTDAQTDNVDSEEKERIYFGPVDLEPDIQEMVDRHEPWRVRHEKTAKIYNWGHRSWENRAESKADVTSWHDILNAAQAFKEDSAPEYFEYGPGFVAAVCVRDHWELMKDKERTWCITRLIADLKRDADSRDHFVQAARSSMNPDRAAAFILPKIMVVEQEELIPSNIHELLAIALTHANTEVQAHAVAGIGQYLAEQDPDFLMGCIGALALQARLQQDIDKRRHEKPFTGSGGLDELYAGVTQTIRDAIVNNEVDSEIEIAQLDFSSWPGQASARLILRIFAYLPKHPLSKVFYRRISDYLVAEWDKKAENYHYSSNYEFNSSCMDLVTNFVLTVEAEAAIHISSPIIEATVKHPKQTAEFVHALVVTEKQQAGESNFWLLWQKFTDQLITAPWLDSLDSSLHDGQDLVIRLFLSTFWDENIRHWRRLEGNAYRIDNLIKQLAGSIHALQQYCRFLYDIGEQSLPQGYKIIAEQLSSETELDSNTIFFLETLLSRHVYGEPFKLKSDQELQQAVISLLDHLVGQGSSSAYRMRDDFVTPLSVNEE